VAKSTEAFATYHQQKEEIAGYLQVASAGIALLRRTIDVQNAPVLLGALVDSCGVKYWGKEKRYNSAIEKVDAGWSALANQGVIQQVAAFDRFSRALVQDVARFSQRARDSHDRLKHDHDLLMLSSADRWVVNHCCNDVAGRLGRLSMRLEELQAWTGWKPSSKLAPTLPLFDLVRSIRNRIAHDGAVIGAELDELARSQKIADAISAFRKYTKRDLPSLPNFARGKRLNLDVVHAILFGAFFYEIAKELNAYAVDLLDDGEFIDMAFFYSCVVDEHPFRTINHVKPESRISHYLASRYLRQRCAPGPDNVINHLTRRELIDSNGKVLSTFWRVAIERHSSLSECGN